jgi:serine/threonine protein kinase
LIELLEKNRQKRPSLEEALQHPWFASFKEIQDQRKKQTDNNGLDTKF